jgi:hypothetical protein
MYPIKSNPRMLRRTQGAIERARLWRILRALAATDITEVTELTRAALLVGYSLSRHPARHPARP